MLLINATNHTIPLAAYAMFYCDEPDNIKVQFSVPAEMQAQASKQSIGAQFSVLCSDAAMFGYQADLLVVNDTVRIKLDDAALPVNVDNYYIGLTFDGERAKVLTNIDVADDYMGCCALLGVVFSGTERPVSNALITKLIGSIQNRKEVSFIGELPMHLFEEGMLAVSIHSKDEMDKVLAHLQSLGFDCGHLASIPFDKTLCKYLYVREQDGRLIIFPHLQAGVDQIMSADAFIEKK